MKKAIDTFLRFFESSEEDDKEAEGLTVIQRIVLFLKGFGNRSLRYKIVWSVRLLAWTVLICAAAFGVALRIKNNIK